MNIEQKENNFASVAHYSEQIKAALAEGKSKNPNMHVTGIIMMPGAGASIITKAMTLLHHFLKVMTSTTRPMENDEIDGEDYHFMLKNKFNTLNIISETYYKIGPFSYGLDADDLIEALRSGQNIVIVLRSLGAQALKDILPNDLVNIEVKVTEETRLERVVEKFRHRLNQAQKVSLRRLFGEKEKVNLDKPEVRKAIDFCIWFESKKPEQAGVKDVFAGDPRDIAEIIAGLTVQVKAAA